MRRFVVSKLLEQRGRLQKTPEWAASMDGAARIPVKEFTIEYGQWKVDNSPVSYTIPADEENIYAVFERCGGVLGEGLHEAYANRSDFRGNINEARLELFNLLQDEKALKLVQHACEREFERLWGEYQEQIEDLSAPLREKCKELRRRGGRVASEMLSLAEVIEIKKESPRWDHHLFVDANGKFGWNAGAWERPILEIEAKRAGFAGFLRNLPRHQWSLCIPHGSANDQPHYPDLLIFTRRKGKVKIDILEPHGDHLDDHLSKAQGMARYAKAHGEGLGRIEMIRLVKDKPERLNMQDEVVRSKVLMAVTAEQLKELYAQYG